MVYSAERSARNAEADTRNQVGMCLAQTRQWCGIPSRYPDASTAWRNANYRKVGDKTNIPRGAAVYWTGGSKGYGHIALSLGGGRIRSTDAGGSGRVATRDLSWFARHWPSLRYAGWAWNINEVHIPNNKPNDSGRS